MSFRKFIKNKIYKNRNIQLLIILFLIILFGNITYNYSSKVSFLKSIGDYVDDNLLYSRSYENNISDNEVVIIKIDNRSLDELQGKSDFTTLGFSKEIYAKTIENIFEEYRANSLGIDIVFANKSISGENDEKILKDVFEKYNDKIVIGTMGDNSLQPLCEYSNLSHGSVFFEAQDRIRKSKIFFPNYNLSNKCDISYKIESQNKDGIEAFSIEVYRKYLLNLDNKLKSKQGLLKLEDNLEKLNKENSGFLYVNYSNNNEDNNGTLGFKSYSLIDIYNNEKNDKITGEKIDLDGKIILIGEVGTIFHDEYLTPIFSDTRMSGVEIHANIITTLLYNSYLKDISEFLKIFLAFIFVGLLIFLMIKVNVFLSLIIFFFYSIIQIIIGLELFSNLIIYPVSFFLYLGILTYIIIYVYQFNTSEKSKKYIRSAFNMYLSSHMVDKIIENPEELNLTGKKGNLTIFFSDIAGFTTISEEMKSEDLFILLNEYLSEMTKILIKNDGTLDKYIGDAVMGFYNAPISVKHHERKACLTALEQIEKLDELNKGWKKRGFPKIHIRIGINSGETMHGNLGAQGQRINYSVIGDSVNLAARLEGINKYYGTKICLSETTYEEVKHDFIFRELDKIKVKGKNKGIKIYQLICEKGKHYDKEVLENYDKGLKDYYDEKYKKAIEHFEKNKDDETSKIMIDRCEKVMKGEIEVVDGVYTMKDK